MRYLITTLLILVISSTAWGVSQIEILPNDNSNNFQGYKFLPPFNKITTSYIDLGESLSSKILKISSTENTLYRVLVQMESSLTIMNEGPHLDLTHWKHCTTDWIESEKITDVLFRLPITEAINSKCFSEVTIPEIKREVFKLGGERWANLIEDDASIHDYPMAVALSSVIIKIEKLVQEKWELITVIQFFIPMGC